MAISPICVLCASENTHLHFENSARAYWQCLHCQLIFVPAPYHLSYDEEKAIYDQHQNTPDDVGYRQFLDKLAKPLEAALKQHQFSPHAEGLDFGSGPGPTLSRMLSERGYIMSIYDIYYANHKNILNKRYDFITSTEVWEHLSDPSTVIDKLFNIGKERCVLGVMTKRIPTTPFESWHYIKDPTHITFFADETFEFIANKYACTLHLPESDTAIFIRD